MTRPAAFGPRCTSRLLALSFFAGIEVLLRKAAISFLRFRFRARKAPARGQPPLGWSKLLRKNLFYRRGCWLASESVATNYCIYKDLRRIWPTSYRPKAPRDPSAMRMFFAPSAALAAIISNPRSCPREFSTSHPIASAKPSRVPRSRCSSSLWNPSSRREKSRARRPDRPSELHRSSSSET